MITRINAISFKGHIIDAHMHSGKWWRYDNLYDHTPDIDTFIKQPLPNGDTVEKIVVSNLDCMVRVEPQGDSAKFLSDELTGNRKLLELAKDKPCIIPLATCQPGYGNSENIKLLLSENPNKFAGLKFHSEQLNIPADANVYNPYMEIAQKEKLPCLFHSGQTFDTPTGTATKVSKPEQIYAIAKRYPDVPVVIAHLGGNGEANTMAAVDCIINSIKNKDANLYADISWIDCDNPSKSTLLQVIRRLRNENALDRIMFGTDAPIGRFGFWGENYVEPLHAYTNNVNEIKEMIKKEFGNDAESITEQIFYKNANDLFVERNWLSKAVKKTSKAKIGIIAGLLALVAGGIGVGAVHQNNSANASQNAQIVVK